MEILYQDARIVAAVKPAGVLSTDEQGGMPELLRGALGQENGCVRTVHRLDRVTGGVMVFARSRMAASILSQQIREHTFQKEYLAIVCGVPPKPEGEFTDLLLRDKAEQKTYVVSQPEKGAKPARLHYRLLGVQGGSSLVRVKLDTGRTHQIRAQFAARQLPLLGDRKYGGDPAPALALWSYRLQFLHPQTGAAMDISKLPPNDEVWSRFSGIFEAWK